MQKIIGYKLVDSKNGKTLKHYTLAQKNSARARATKLDNQYGAYRYSCTPIFVTV